jgi:hypothetical protein
MPTSIEKEERQGVIRKFLSSLRFPQLFLLLAALFAVDMVTPDPILFIDEAILGVLAVMLGMWRGRGEREPEDISEMKNITPDKDA